MAEEAAEQAKKKLKEKTKHDAFKSFLKAPIVNEVPKISTTNLLLSSPTSESKNIANLVKLKQLYEKYENLVDKKMIENILKEKKYNFFR